MPQRDGDPMKKVSAVLILHFCIIYRGKVVFSINKLIGDWRPFLSRIQKGGKDGNV
jgi:hypothetical protein